MNQTGPVQTHARPPRYARASEACRHFRISRSTLWLWAKTRTGFPSPIKAGAKVTLFDLEAIDEFLRTDACGSEK